MTTLTAGLARQFYWSTSCQHCGKLQFTLGSHSQFRSEQLTDEIERNTALIE
ncbi:MAG: hypothetical protein E5Y74_29415, partial [Mesorhizobium sp.]